jgi:hypothetical protein
MKKFLEKLIFTSNIYIHIIRSIRSDTVRDCILPTLIQKKCCKTKNSIARFMQEHKNTSPWQRADIPQHTILLRTLILAQLARSALLKTTTNTIYNTHNLRNHHTSPLALTYLNATGDYKLRTFMETIGIHEHRLSSRP